MMPFVNPIIGEAREKILISQYAKDDALAAARAAEAEAVEALIRWVDEQIDLSEDDAHHVANWDDAMVLQMILSKARAERVRLEGKT